MTATKIPDEPAGRGRGLSAGGSGAIVLLAQTIELIPEIDRTLHLLKRQRPDHESDPVRNIAFPRLAGGRRIEHLALRRKDEVDLDALRARRIPDPTTAGDFGRRVSQADVLTWRDTIHAARLRVGAQQPPEFFAEAILEADGRVVPRDAACQRGRDFASDGQSGDPPRVIARAHPAEPWFLFHRGGHRPSQQRADVFRDQAVALVRRAGFRTIRIRGDTPFAPTKHRDRGDAAGDIRFVVGSEA
jgi:hypothetical protein